MTPTQLFRWSGVALASAGCLIGLGFLLHPDISQPHAAEQARWIPAHVVLLLSLLFTLFGVIGLFLRQSAHAGWLGLIGFVLTTAGIILTAIAITADAFIFPLIELTPGAAALADPAGPLLNGPLGIMLISATITFALGAITLGLATFIAGELSRWAALLLIIGGPLLAADPLLPQLVVMAGALLTSGSFIGLGIELIGQRVPSTSPGQVGAAS